MGTLKSEQKCVNNIYSIVIEGCLAAHIATTPLLIGAALGIQKPRPLRRFSRCRCNITYLDNTSLQSQCLLSSVFDRLRRPVMVQVITNQPQHRNVETNLPSPQHPPSHKMIHPVSNPFSFPGDQKWQDLLELVSLKVLVPEQYSKIEGPGKDRVPNRARMEIRD